MASGSCYTCQGRPPICSECFDELRARWSSGARTFGWRWGAGLRVALDHNGTAAKSWPAWESDKACDVRRICRRIVAPLANSVPERRDERLVDVFAQLCAAAAHEAYSTLTVDEARAFVADHDRRHPTWRADVVRRIRDTAQ